MQSWLASLIRLDLLLESVAGLIALAISHYANKAYQLTEQKRLSDLSSGFIVLSAAMFGRVIGTIYFFILSGDGSGNANLMMAVVTIAYGAMKIMAYVLFAISTRPTKSPTLEGGMVLLALPVLVDPNLDLVAILVLIVVVIQALMNYMSTRSKYAAYVLAGFTLLLLSHVVAIPAQTQLGGYALSQVAQFLGFIFFLVMLVKAGKE
jgi:hypothetical protein